MTGCSTRPLIRVCSWSILLLRAALVPAQDLPPQVHPQWLDVEINGVAVSEPAIAMVTDDGQLWLACRTLADWRFLVPATLTHEFLGRTYCSLSAVFHGEDVQWSVDEQRQILSLRAVPAALQTTSMAISTQQSGASSTPDPGAYLNYDLNAQRLDGAQVNSGLFELGLFRGQWLAQQSVVAAGRQYSGPTTRLDTTLTGDFPAQRSTLQLGDATSAGGDWGNSLRFAGVRWATNFLIQPDLITFPLPAISGSAALPSTVDIFVNGALAATRNVAPGPFNFTQIPVVSGDGVITAQVRDLWGNVRTISQSFFASPQLLRAGLDAYSFEAGAVRQQYGLESDGYGPGFIAGTWRRGLTDALTAEARSELSPGLETVGVSLATRFNGAVLAQLAVVGSNAGGSLLRLDVERTTGQCGAGLDLRVANTRFRQLGDDNPDRLMRRSLAVSASCYLPFMGSVGFTYVNRTGSNQANLLTGTWSRTIAGRVYLSASVTDNINSGGSGLSAFLTLTWSFAQRVSASVAATQSDHHTSSRFEIERAVPTDNGFGLQLSGEDGVDKRLVADAAYQNRSGLFTGSIVSQPGASGLRLSATGSVGLLDGALLAMRHVDGNFAVVEVPATPGVPVYVENRLVGVTDASGMIAVTGLRAYERNEIRIDPVDLPLNTAVADPVVESVPNGRGGTFIKLAVESVTPVLLQLVQDDGTPVPAGARALQDGVEHPVASDGRLYLQHGTTWLDLTATWPAGQCSVHHAVLLHDRQAAQQQVPCHAALSVGAAPATAASTAAR